MAIKLIKDQMTIAEAAKRQKIDGNLANIIEVLNEENPFFTDAATKQASDHTSHVMTRRKSLPTVGHRRINEGAQETLSTTEQIRENITHLEDWVKIDEMILKQQSDRKEFLKGETRAHAEAMAQAAATLLLYGNAGSDPEAINGLLTRYNALALANCVGLGGTGSDLATLLMVEWDPEKIFLIHPRGAKGVGLGEKDLGIETVSDASGNPYRAYRYQMMQDYGLAVGEDDVVQRLCNIESSGTSNTLFDTNKMREVLKARNRLPKAGKRAVIYVNRDLKSQIDIYADEKSNIAYTKRDVETGLPITYFHGIPVRLADAMLSTESAVS
jgi:hypothetical protein